MVDLRKVMQESHQDELMEEIYSFKSGLVQCIVRRGKVHAHTAMLHFRVVDWYMTRECNAEVRNKIWSERRCLNLEASTSFECFDWKALNCTRSIELGIVAAGIDEHLLYSLVTRLRQEYKDLRPLSYQTTSPAQHIIIIQSDLSHNHDHHRKAPRTAKQA
jgi:hypothetical protein